MEELDEILDYRVLEMGSYEVTSHQILTALGILLATIVAMKFIQILIRKKSKDEYDLGRKSRVFLLFKYFIWVIVTALCLETIGVKVTILIAGSAALLVGLGLGLQQLFNDVVSGVLMLLEGTIQVNNIIEVEGMVVRVTEINLRTSKVITRDDVVITLPNHKFVSENVINWSYEKGYTRFMVRVGVAYESDVNLVSKLLEEAMSEHQDISSFPSKMPLVRFTDFGDSALIFDALFYTHNIFRAPNIQSELRYSIHKKFKQNKISIPFPQRDLHIKSSEIGTFS